MADYRYSIHDASTGLMLVEAPFSGVQFSRVLSGVGTFTGSLPVLHPAATEANLGVLTSSADREVVVWRDDVAIWNGPIVGCEPNATDDTFTVTAREASWYYSKRTLEINKNYDGDDIFDIVRDLDDYAQTKTANGSDGMTAGADIVADLPRWAISPASTDAGATYSDPSPPTFYGANRHTILDCLQAIAADPETGFEWRTDFATGSSKQSVKRTIVLGYPQLGSTLGITLTEAVLLNYGRTTDMERAGTRTHTRWSGGVKTRQSSAAVSDGVLLTEAVGDFTKTRKDATAQAFSKDFRRRARPPVRTVSAVIVPSALGLAWGFCDLGDTIPFQITTPNIVSLTADTRRVVQIDYTPESGEAPETMSLTFNIRLDDLGA